MIIFRLILALFFLTIAFNRAFAEIKIDMEVVAEGLEHPWSLCFFSDGRMLVTERPGRMRIVTQDGYVSSPISGLPKVFNEGQGGLLDVIIDPEFEKNRFIYFSYAEQENSVAGTAVARAKLKNSKIEDITVIFRQYPKTDGENHFGSRLAFAKDGTLFVTLGERFDEMDEAQNPENHLGSIVRINPDGSIPEDNPFIDNIKMKPEIWSYGHRNVQGAALNPITGQLWTHEHGPRGGDEINIPEAGKNYGWPKASYGIHYWMIPIKSNHSSQGFEEPVYHWTPSIAPSGMTFYTGNIFPQWKGNLFLGALAGKHLVRLTLDGNKVLNEEKLLDDMEYRIRDVKQSPDGYLYVITDSQNGKILRITPHK
ncbi:PQQ-dependent sugar dehydrogenase [Rickettsiales bacterium]|nr:PQQ-dependent sugar dehydrogenase [Rickettsiales bacterium]